MIVRIRLNDESNNDFYMIIIKEFNLGILHTYKELQTKFKLDEYPEFIKRLLNYK